MLRWNIRQIIVMTLLSVFGVFFSSPGTLPHAAASEADERIPITPENAAQVREVDLLGRGYIHALDWIAQDRLIVSGSQHLVYDPADLTQPLAIDPADLLQQRRELPYYVTTTNDRVVLVNRETDSMEFVLIPQPRYKSPREVYFNEDGTLMAYWYDIRIRNTEGYLQWRDFVRVYDLTRFEIRNEFEIPGWMQALEFSPDNTAMAIATWDLMGESQYDFSIWSISTGSPQLSIVNRDFTKINALSFSPDGTSIAGGSVYGDVMIWDVATGQQTAIHRTIGSIDWLRFSPDSQMLLSNGYFSLPRLWWLDTKREVMLPTAPAIFSPDSTQLHFIDAGSLVTWDIATQQPTATVPQPSYTRLSPGGVLGLRAGEGYYHLIDTTSGKQIRLNYAEAQFVSDAVLLVRDADEIQHLWRMPDGVIHTFGVSETVRHVAISPDGRRMAYTNRYPGDVLLWDLSSGAPALLHQLLDENGVSAPYSYYTNVIAFSPDGRILAAAGDPEIRLWDVETGELLAVLEGHAEAVEALVFSPDGTLIASSGSGANDGAFEVISQEKVIHLWGIPQNPS